MDNNNPIKYSDLISPDNSIELLIKQLSEAREVYVDTAKGIRTEAEKLREVLKGMPSGVPDPETTTRTAKETNRLAKAQKELDYAYTRNGRTLQRLNTLKTERNRLTRLEQKANKAAAGSYDQLSAKASLLAIRYNSLSIEQRENTKEGQRLQKQLAETRAEMNRIQSSVGNYKLNVGNYSSALAGLNFATQQVVRELPSLTISANQFFLAISNNIPILVDQINNLRIANEKAAATGKATTSIISGIARSLISWQSLLIVGLTIVSKYGDEIWEWAKSLVKGREILDAATASAKYFNETMQQGAVDAVDETTKLDLLYRTATDTAVAMDTRRAAAEELQRMYPDYLGNMSAEEIMLGKALERYQDLSVAIIEYAKAKAAENQIIENTTKLQKIANVVDIEALREARDNYVNLRNEYQRTLNDEIGARMQDAKQIYDDLVPDKDVLKDLEIPKHTEDLVDLYDALTATNTKLVEIAKNSIGNDPRSSAKTDAEKEAQKEAEEAEKERKRQAEEAEKDRLDARKRAEEQYQRLTKLRRDYEDKELESEQDKWVKRRKQTQYEYDREIEDLRHALETQTDLTAEEREIINATIVLLQQQRKDELVKIDKEQNVAELEAREKGINDQIKAEEKGSDRYFQLLLQRNRIALELALARNKLLSDAEKKSVDEIKQMYAQLAAEITNDWIETQDKNLTDTAEKEEKLHQKRIDKIRSIFNTAKSEISQFSKNSAEAIDAMRRIFNTEFIKDGFDENGDQKFTTLGDKIGGWLGLDKEGLLQLEKGMETAAMVGGTIIGIIQDVAAARVEAADKAVESSRREVEAARDALQAELTARNEGYAHNVAQARKELELAKRTEKQALAEKQRAQRQQLAMDSISQASNLVTASALVWSQLGFPWAIAAIGSMFASFAASKILAARATRETYGDGTVELLHGGSHQSGNDIDLGTKPDGTRRRAEGGEYFAVINKRASRNNGALIRDVIHSLNDGTFAKKYQGAYDMGGGLMLNVGGSSPDLRRLSDDVRKIKEQNERRTYLDSEGNVVEVYKNVKRVIKKC